MLRRTMVGMLWVSVALAFTGARLETRVTSRLTSPVGPAADPWVGVALGRRYSLSPGQDRPTPSINP